MGLAGGKKSKRREKIVERGMLFQGLVRQGKCAVDGRFSTGPHTPMALHLPVRWTIDLWTHSHRKLYTRTER